MKPTCSNHYVRSCEQCYLRDNKDPDTVLDSEDEDDDLYEPEEAQQSTSSAPPAKRRRKPII